MPRKASSKSCVTCRKRKIKCDENFPDCDRCMKAGLHCDRSSELVIKHFDGWSASAVERPRGQLKQPHIADLYQIYIKDIAPWYDLNDEHRNFARTAAARALDSPLLFASAIALSALYSARKASSSAKLAESFHARCISYLIELTPDDAALQDGTALAATCLLRSYEILSEAVDPNRHLFGASTILPPQPAGFSNQTLTMAGFWNFLREDITYSLIHRCPLKIKVRRSTSEPITSEDFANAATILVARAINLSFAPIPTSAPEEWEALGTDVELWLSAFGADPFASHTDDTTTFPKLMMLEDSQVAALHYQYVTQGILAAEGEYRADLAGKICGLAMFSRSDPATVNSYGPICFTARWLSSKTQQQHLVNWLKNSQKRTAWPVEGIVIQLQECWAAAELRTSRKREGESYEVPTTT